METNAAQFTSIVVLTGAGISAESGLKTFRDNNGLWEDHAIEDVATPEAFQRNPALVHRFYNLRRAQLLGNALPNKAHQALAAFEKIFAGEFTLITQNVDNLHEQAGSENLIHMHGELLKANCISCGDVIPWETDLDVFTESPCCHAAGSLRPHIVWFGEIPLQMEKIEAHLAACDLFVSIGTSGNVYPAAGFVQLARHAGAECVELNLEPSAGTTLFHTHIQGPATVSVPAFFATVCKQNQV